MPRLSLILAILSALTLAACQRSDGAAKGRDGDVVVAQVSGRQVWASDVRREAVVQGLTDDQAGLPIGSDLFRRVLDEVIDQKLLAIEAERRRLQDDPAAQRRLQATRERILGDILVESVVDGAVSEAAIATLYREQLRLARTTEELRPRLIVTATRPEAEAVLGLLGQGAPFEGLASERSIDAATRVAGGDLGYATLDVMPRPYAQVLATAAVGQVVGPVQTEGGWAVLKVEDRRPATPPTLAEARPLIVRYLTYERVRQLLEELRGQAEIEVRLNSDAPAAPAPKSRTGGPA